MKSRSKVDLSNHSNYLMGFGVGSFIAGMNMAVYNSRGWLWVVIGAVSMIAGGIYGTLAKTKKE